MYQLRIYTLRTVEALEQYATVHWTRHISSLRDFGVTTHGIWTQHDADAHRLLALISYPEGADPTEVATAYMASPGFAADMDGFDVSDIITVEDLLLDPAAASPLS
ncbi:NIPSNAP family protein [Nocardia sp. NPDC049707]|uniref:NIPSNAP family protein n=1 Tax=Nocardia sp. NPDC049707 TaxID=3154735 RepID=UPI0034173FEA